MRHKARFALRVFGWLVIGLVTLELCARTEDKIRYGAPFWDSYNMDRLYAFDPLGKFGRPNASYLKWHLNEAGYRGPALRAGTYRIACVGSSETFGMYETPEHEWPRQLENILNGDNRNRPYEVVDVAYPGMSIATAITRLPQIVSVLQPKVVVIYPSYTPYIDLNHSWTPPIPQPPPAPVALPFWRSFEPRLGGRFNTLMKATLPMKVQDWLRAKDVERDSRGMVVMDSLPEQNIRAFKSDLDTLTQQFLSHGVRVILVTHANRFGSKNDPADVPLLVDWRKFFPTLREQGFLDMEKRMSEAVRQVARERSVSMVDAAAYIPPGRENFVEFVHFNDAGAKALATIVASQVDEIPEAQGAQASKNVSVVQH